MLERYIHFQNLGEMLKAVTLASVILLTLLEYSENRAKMLTLYWYSWICYRTRQFLEKKSCLLPSGFCKIGSIMLSNRKMI
jgi:hypothetical protein